jgi:hypothetical protein
MYARLGLALVMSLPMTTTVWAQARRDLVAHRPPPKACMQRLHHDEADLPAASRQARDRLIANPARIDLVAGAAAAADSRRRAEIELGIFRAAEWLQCLDPSGYQALAAYLHAHADNPVVVDLEKALNAQASAGTPNSGAVPGSGNAGGFNSSPGAGASFSAATVVVSPSH